MKCPHCGRDVGRAARRCACGVSRSPETIANALQGRDLVGGHFYPLEVRKALSLEQGSAYIEQAAKRARREKDSARNMASRRAARAATADLRAARARSP